MVTASTLLTAIFNISYSFKTQLYSSRDKSGYLASSQHMAIIQFHLDIPPLNSVTRDT